MSPGCLSFLTELLTDKIIIRGLEREWNTGKYEICRKIINFQESFPMSLEINSIDGSYRAGSMER